MYVTHPVDQVPELAVERRADGEAAAAWSALGLIGVVHEKRHALVHPV